MATKKYLDEVGLSDVAAHVNNRLKTVTEMPSSANDEAVRLYVGETDDYTKGHIYQYDEENSKWNDITPASGSASSWDTVTEMPATGVEGQVVLYKGHSTSEYAYGGFYQCVNGEWVFLGALIQLVEVPFNLTLTSITPIAEGDTTRTLTFTASTESVVTEESFGGVLANGVIQGKFWNDIGGSISQVDETTFQVTLDTNLNDSLGQLAQFPEGSSITIPSFSWIDGITQYIHNSETISISEEVITQKLAFNTTGVLDSSTGITTFGISSAYEIPFVLSYENISTVTMIDSNYENEVTQSWTPSIVAANDTTTLVFTPNDSTALHGDNIAITAGTLTAVSNGITYTYDFSTDNINLRWGNTTWSFGVYNNFASFTAAPTSANTGSATLTLNPTGPGATERELAFMSNLLPTVTIADSGETKEFSTVTWTEGSIVVSDASEVTSVANKLITVTWNEDVTSDFDAYGVECFVNVNSLSLSATCAYVEHNITFSDPVLNHTSEETDVQVQLTTSEELPDTLYVDYTEVTLRTRAVLQGRLVTSDSTSNASASGTSFYINDIPNLVDSLGQRAVYSIGSNVVIGAFEYIDGDDKYIHASQTINATETLTTQKLAFNTTGTLDSSTGVTTFIINASNVVPFVLSTTDTFTATMLDAGYGSETTVTWTPSINYGDSDTELIFTPDNTTALHGDNITFENKVLNFVSNGVTYEIDTSEDTLNARWANTSYDFGTFNNFASFTAVPTSANSGSVTCTLSPTGPGDDQFELDIMAANLPTVTIDSVQCGTVAWTQGQIVASGASGVTIVGGKTVDIVWDGGNYSDTDSYGITRNVTFASKALSATCGYVDVTDSYTFSAISQDSNGVYLDYTSNYTSVESHLLTPTGGVGLNAVSQAQAKSFAVGTIERSVALGTTIRFRIPNALDSFNQRPYMTSSHGGFVCHLPSYIDGDYQIAASIISEPRSESNIPSQRIDLNADGVIVQKNTTEFSSTITFNSNISKKAGTSSDAIQGRLSFNVVNGLSVKTLSYRAFTYHGSYTSVVTPAVMSFTTSGTGSKFYFGDDITVTIGDVESWETSEELLTAFGINLVIGHQSFTVPPYSTSMSSTVDTITRISSSSYASGGMTNQIYGTPITGNTSTGELLKEKLNVSITTSNGTYVPDFDNYTTISAFTYDLNTTTPSELKADGTITISWPIFTLDYEIPDSSGFIVEVYATSPKTLTGNHYYEEYYDDDDCDDD